jgi:hypothetical protein
MRPIAWGISRVVGTVGLAVGVLVGAGTVPMLQLSSLPTPSLTPHPSPSIVPVTSALLLCPGPQTEGLTGVPVTRGTTTVYAAAAPEALLPDDLRSTAAAIGGVTTLPGGTVLAPVPAPGRRTQAVVKGAVAAQVLSEGGTPGVVATQTFLAAEGDTRAYVATVCRSPAAEHWLVAGGADPTRRERLVLVNPGANPVTVRVQVHGTAGILPASSSDSVTVPAAGRSSLLLDALVPQEASPVVHVVATGGTIAATLDDAWIVKATGRGADDAGSSAPPATDLVVPVGLGKVSTLRVAVPGDSPADVQVRVLTADGPRTLPSGGVAKVAGGATKDISLAAVTDRAFAIHVRSSVPVVAAALIQRFATVEPGTAAAATPADLAWAPAVPPLTLLGGVALGPAANPDGAATLVLSSAQGAATVRVTTVVKGVSTSRRVTVPEAGSVTVDAAAASEVWIQPQTGHVYAAVVIGRRDVSDLVAVLPMTDIQLRAPAVIVRPDDQNVS